MPPPKRGTSSRSRSRVIDPNLRALLETTKRETRLLGDIQRSLLSPGSRDERRSDVLHPSEISHSDWCPRASYYRLAGRKPNADPPVTHWQMQMIFDEGHEIHRKWQERIWNLGRLSGMFYCISCQWAWYATAPSECEKCGASRRFLKYQEVPLYNDTLRMAGHADGIDGDNVALIEIKSIGVNTLRFEAPGLLKEHTYKLNVNGRSREFLDHDALWDSIRVPFPSHIRQGHFYSFLGAPRDEIFIYECKWNQRVKEMVVKYREERIAPQIDAVTRICTALQGGPIPRCPFDGCADCQRYEGSSDEPKRRILVRRTTTQAAAAAQSARDGHVGQNGERRPPRRLLRPGSSRA
jgi:hypothetical protein